MPAAEVATHSPPPATETPTLTRTQKLAALLVMLGPEAAGQILRTLEPQEVERISVEMAGFSLIGHDLQREILREFSEVAVQAGTAIRGGVEVARATLEKAMGQPKAAEILARVAPTGSSVQALQELLAMEPRQVYNLLRHEQPQTIALVLSYFDPAKAAAALSFCPSEERDQVLERIATLAPSPTDVVEKVVEVLLAKRGVNRPRALSQTGGTKTAADLLNALDKAQGTTLLGAIERRNPELGQEIRQKMFTFADLAGLNPTALQRILREVDTRELALALKSANDKLKTALLSGITKRAAETVQEEMAYMGAVRLRDIESAQRRVVEVVRRLEAEGAIDLEDARQEASSL